MVNIRTFNLASDDIFWVVSGIPWHPGTSSVSGIFQSPVDFIAAYGIKVGQYQHTPTVQNRYSVLFEQLTRNSGPGHSVTGIDGTSFVTVGINPNIGLDINSLNGIPATSPVLVTLAPISVSGPGLNEGLAGIHWEISRNSPHDPTTPEELSNHLLETLADSSLILSHYASRLSGSLTNAKVTFVDNNNNELPNRPSFQSIRVEYRQLRTVICECDSTRTDEISCNSDIGTYYIDANGVLHIVIGSTTVKIY